VMHLLIPDYRGPLVRIVGLVGPPVAIRPAPEGEWVRLRRNPFTGEYVALDRHLVRREGQQILEAFA
jgi:hypothetical protein